MEPKLISLIEKEMPTWRTDFDVAEWKRSCDLYTTAYGWLSNEKLDILKIEKREQYRQLFLEFARKPLGFCTYRRDGPTDNFGESDSWGYEKILFELEEFKCNNNRYSECPFNLKNILTIVKDCPENCKEKKKGIFVTRLNEPWARNVLIKFCLENYLSLNPEEKQDLEDNLRVVQQYGDLSLCKEEYHNDYDRSRLFSGTSWYPNPSLLRKFPRIAQKFKKHQGETK